MSHFNHAIEVVLKNEGGYVNHPNDPGGETNFGITKRSYPTIDIKNLTKEQAKEIYKRDWWDRYKYDRIQDRDIATKVFDLSVNMGARQAHRLLQRSINFAENASLKEDGLIGPLTLHALNIGNPKKIIISLEYVAAKFYFSLAERRPKSRTFLFGWLRRAYH